MGEDPDCVASESPIRTAPRICEFATEYGPSKHIIFIEQESVCETGALTRAIFLWFSSHYVFHLCYDHVYQTCVFSFKSSFLGCHVPTLDHPRTWAKPLTYKGSLPIDIIVFINSICILYPTFQPLYPYQNNIFQQFQKLLSKLTISFPFYKVKLFSWQIIFTA